MLKYENGIHTSKTGAKQSNLQTRFDLVDPLAMLELANVLFHGAKKYGDDNWRGIEVDDHLNHAIAHLNKYLINRKLEELTHAFCRIMFAVAKHIRPDFMGKFKVK